MRKCKHCGVDIPKGEQCNCADALEARSEGLVRKIKSKPLRRTFEFNRAEVDEEKRTVPLAFSSEEPVNRWFGDEILDHDRKSVRLDRLKNAGAVLWNHDTNVQIGVPEDIIIDKDRIGRAIIRFGKSARAEEIFQDVLDDIIRNVSFGYRIYEMRLEEEKEGQPDRYRATDWEPYEISLVSIPADTTVGIGRAEGEAENEIKITGGKRAMNKCKHCGTELADGVQCSCPGAVAARAAAIPPAAQKVDIAVIEGDATKRALERASAIIALGDQFNCTDLAREHLQSDKTVDQLREAILKEKFDGKVDPASTPNIGLDRKEAKRFSFAKAINAAASGDWREAGFEKECSQAVQDHLKKEPVARGFSVPHEVLQVEASRFMDPGSMQKAKRDLTVGVDPAGGYTVATNLLTSSFIEMLRNRMMVKSMGAQILGGLVGDVAIPKQSGGAQGYWVGESNDPTESNQTIAQLGMTPKTVGAYTDYSRKLAVQSSLDVENFIRNDLSLVLALALDLAAINGSGSDHQPKGILNVTGIGDVAGGTNGLAPTWAHMINLWKETAKDNAAFGNLGFLTNADVIGKLMTVEKASSTGQFVVSNFPDANGITGIGGMRCGASNQVPNNLTKGTASEICSAILFGNWSDLIIGEWGGIDVLVDPYTGGLAGTTRVRVLQDVDIQVRHAESFSAMKDALTT